MAMTTYTGETEIITNIGTTPDERGLSTDEFKAKFDEGLKAFVTWFNDTHKTEFDAITTPPSCRVYNSSNQSISNGTITAIQFNSERFDNDTIHDSATNNTRLTCKTAGKYLVIGQIKFAFNSTGYRELDIVVNGTTFYAASTVLPVSTANYSVISTIINLSVNDYVELMVKQTSGGELDVVAEEAISPEFMMVKIG
jgi:hypothetical protein